MVIDELWAAMAGRKRIHGRIGRQRPSIEVTGYFDHRPKAVGQGRVSPHTGQRGFRLPWDMPLLNVVLTLVVVGVLLWLINTYIPMQATVKKILNIVVVVVLILWLLYGFGVISGGEVRLPVVK